jgi:hypothetical protein
MSILAPLARARALVACTHANRARNSGQIAEGQRILPRQRGKRNRTCRFRPAVRASPLYLDHCNMPRNAPDRHLGGNRVTPLNRSRPYYFRRVGRAYVGTLQSIPVDGRAPLIDLALSMHTLAGRQRSSNQYCRGNQQQNAPCPGQPKRQRTHRRDHVPLLARPAARPMRYSIRTAPNAPRCTP